MADSIPSARRPQEQSVAEAHAVGPGESGLRTLIDAASDAIISIDSQHRIMLFNRAASEAFGWTEAEALGRPLSMLLPPEARADHDAKIHAFATEPQAWRRMTGERPRTTGQRKNGTRFPAEVTISKAFVEGEWRFTAIVRDVSERHAFEDRLERLSRYDSLTGLPNRALLSERLATALATIQEGAAVAVLFVDIDHFKRINDALGHIAGDELLAEFATRLLANTRKKDTVARFGGDEFLILAESEPDGDSAVTIAQRLLQAWRQPFELGGRAITVTASVGIGIARSAQVAPGALVRDADVALYRAKDLGRNRAELFDPASGGWAAERLDLERGLEHAIALGEMEVHYQPVVALADGTITGFEALLRWRHGDRMISPAEFIPVAEETGLITGIGSWVLEQACAQAVLFAEGAGRDLDMAVNWSPRQAASPDMAQEVAEVLERTGLPARLLTLEITETFMLQDGEAIPRALDAVRALGVQLALDDFGTGYSSLSHLRRIPVTTVKIDRSFMSDVTTLGSEDHTIVTGVIALAHALRLRVTAEGIETPEQARTLRDLGADQAQGYHFSRPVPAALALALLRPPVSAGR